jgi:aldose 1-epimerase
VEADPRTPALPPRVYELDDGAGLRVALMDIGATWLSCRLRLPQGGEREVLLGHAQPQDHLREGGYLGGLIGRYANRIAGARYRLDGIEQRLAANEGPNQLHGGPQGFHRRRWQVLEATPRELRLKLVSPEGDQGFPGVLTVEAVYAFNAPGELSLSWAAHCTAACPVNLTSHAYFNLDGDARSIAGHELQIMADEVLPVDAAQIPTGQVLPVAGTAFDFRHARPAIGDDGRVYDHCWRLAARCAGARHPAATLTSADSRVTVAIFTTLPGLQHYSGQHLAEAHGRDGRPFAPSAGIALEPQFFPDSPNRPEWPQPSCVLRPGAVMSHQIRWRFSVR